MKEDCEFDSLKLKFENIKNCLDQYDNWQESYNDLLEIEKIFGDMRLLLNEMNSKCKELNVSEIQLLFNKYSELKL